MTAADTGSKRTRRHAYGARNPWAAIHPSCEQTRHPSPLRSASPTRSHTEAPLLLGNHADRAVLTHLQDKLLTTANQAAVRHVMRSYDTDHTGRISCQDLTAALQRLHVGLSPSEEQQLLARADRNGSGTVDWSAFLSDLHSLQPLADLASGAAAGGAEAGSAGAGPSNGPWAPWLQGRPSPQAVEWRAHPPGLPGAACPPGAPPSQRKQQDAVLMAFLTERIAAARPFLRRRFRCQPHNAQGQVNRKDFVAALSLLHMPEISHQDLERVFELMDPQGSGLIHYEDLFTALDTDLHLHQARPHARPPPALPCPGPPSPTSSSQEAEVQALLSAPLTCALQQQCAARAGVARQVFAGRDVRGDGHLQPADLSQCCQQLVPSLPQHHAHALVAAWEASHSGHHYRDFMAWLDASTPCHTQAAPQPLPLPRALGPPAPAAPFPTLPCSQLRSPESSTSHPAQHSAAAIPEPSSPSRHPSPARLTLGHSPLWQRPLTPPSLRATRLATARGPCTTGDVSSAASSPLDAPTALLPNVTRSDGCFATVSIGAGMDPGCVTARPASLPVLNIVSNSGRMGHSASELDLCRSKSRGHHSLELSRALSFANDVATAQPATAGDHGSKKGRFWALLHPDTQHITQVTPGCSQHAGPEHTYVRKHDPGFASFQNEDRERKALKAQRDVLRFDAKAGVEHSQAAGQTAARQERDMERLHTMGMRKARYEERAALYEELRGQAVERSPPHALFAQATPYTDHAIYDPVLKVH
ncbi:hypothetical protein V8C86DRAFT_2622462 [Haematococcus lacustris]